MELSVLERLVLLQYLPREGDYTTVKIIRQLRENLSFSEEEHALLQFKTEGTSMRWTPGLPPRDISIGGKATSVIVDTFKALDRQKKLPQDCLDLYERFIPPED